MMNKNYIILYLGLIVLFLTTFPLCQGWIPLGDFRPRFLFLMAVLVLDPKLLFNKPMLLLFAYFAYTGLLHFANDSFNLSGHVANVMEFAIPAVLGLSVMKHNDEKEIKILSVFAIVLTIANMIISINACRIYPDAIRGLVGATALGDIQMAQKYSRLGVCGYGFAAMMMLTPTLAYNIMKCCTRKWQRFLCLMVIFLSFVFLYYAGVTTPLLISLILLLYSVFFKEVSLKQLIVLGCVGSMVIPVLLTLLSDIPIFEGTNFESRIDTLNSAANGGNIEDDGDLAIRLSLIIKTLTAIFKNPLFGSLNADIGGHNYLLDIVAKYGMLGFILFFSFFKSMYKMISTFLPASQKYVFSLCVMGVIILGILKNCSGIEYWLYMLLYIPVILSYYHSQYS